MIISRSVATSAIILTALAGASTTAPAFAAAPPTSAAAIRTVTDSIESGSVKVNADLSALDFTRMTQTAANGELRVTIPVATGGTPFSNLQLVVNRDNEVTDYSEVHVTEYTPDAGHVTTWSKDQVVLDQDFTAATDRAIKRGIGDAVRELNSCLSGAGIPAWLLTAVMTACRFAIGPGLAACLIGGGIGEATAAYCQGRALSKL
ncbi:hypothetical protein ACFWF7_34640 [Nocardia sp. NPDC060256]|uniref:hypothetical protein n=1 Tax=unclassified Nocardia TaxID=2637762 RepID=UPI0036466AAE